MFPTRTLSASTGSFRTDDGAVKRRCDDDVNDDDESRRRLFFSRALTAPRKSGKMSGARLCMRARGNFEKGRKSCNRPLGCRCRSASEADAAETNSISLRFNAFFRSPSRRSSSFIVAVVCKKGSRAENFYSRSAFKHKVAQKSASASIAASAAAATATGREIPHFGAKNAKEDFNDKLGKNWSLVSN